jgi:YHS domain-containing protein
MRGLRLGGGKFLQDRQVRAHLQILQRQADRLPGLQVTGNRTSPSPPATKKGKLMKNRYFSITAALILSGVGTVLARHENHTNNAEKTSANTAEVKAQTKCPVMGGAVDKALFVDYDGKRIYVCCDGCIAKIKKDPAKYVKQLEAEGVTLDKAAAAKSK